MPFKRTLRRSIIKVRAPANEPPYNAYYYQFRMDRLVLALKPQYVTARTQHRMRDMRNIRRFVVAVEKDGPVPAALRAPPTHHTRWARRLIKK